MQNLPGTSSLSTASNSRFWRRGSRKSEVAVIDRRHPLLVLAIYIVLIFWSILSVAPLLYMVSTAFKPNQYVFEFPPKFIPENPTTENFEQAWNSNNFGLYFSNSLVVSVAATAIILVLSSMMAFAFARYSFPGRTTLFYAILGTMMVPGLVLIIPQFVLAKNLLLLNSLHGLVVAYSANSAVNIFFLRGAFEEIPQDLQDAAAIDGAGIWATFWRIMLPLVKPSLAAMAIFSFMGAWDEFTWALTSIQDETLRTLPIGLRLFQQSHGTQWGLVFAASLIAVVPVIIVFLIFQRYFIQGISSGAVKG
ncbi:MAG: transporter permease [Chloroflexi bacterium]|jgi:multiple sugar transport system permease protein|nr:transporter permease [Chloroflexota bacterium]